MNDVEFYLEDLKSKFSKIEPNEYFLSYSGGRDSHFLYWFLKVWLPKNDFNMWLKYKDIKIVGVNTRMEHPEILRRILDFSDVVLLPEKKPYDIKKEKGIPLYSKIQDEFIMRYQNGSRSENTMKVINGENVWFNLNKKGREILLSGGLHKIGNCCDYLKKKPIKKYKKEVGKKEILGVRGSEGKLRKSKYTSCFTKDGKFTPIWDLEDDLFEKIYNQYNIPIPNIYNWVDRTGCMGCPFGKNIKREIDVLPKNRRRFVVDYFKESYDVLGIEYETKQQNIFDLIDKG